MNKKKKICLLTPGKIPVPAVQGGTSERLTALIAETAGDETELHIISVYDEEAVKLSAKYEKAVFHHISCEEKDKQRYKSLKRFCRKLFRFNPVIWDPYLKAAIKIIKKEKFDWVIAENAIYYINPVKTFTSARVAFHIHNACRQLTPFAPGPLMKKADAVIAVSRYCAAAVKKAGYDGDVYTVKDATDTDMFKKGGEERASLREKLGLAPDDFVVIYSGRFIPEKGIVKLMNAIELINDEKVKLLAVGGTALREEGINEFETKLKKRADASGKRIIFAGDVKHDRLPAYYHCADVAVFPSLWDEAGGVSAIEAMSAGLPVIVSDSGGITEYSGYDGAIAVRRDDNFTITLGQKIEVLKNDEEKRAEMSRIAVETAEIYAKKDYGKKLFELLAEIEED